ncbi:hypothetical protein lerEdw1_020189 [Lerista edwardsae]|nr:hypothetical protein lerEdw1_020189 [Lerista edwardsae]
MGGEQNPGDSSIQYGKLTEIDLSTSQDCNIQKLIEQSTSLPVFKSDETENKESPHSCFGREALLYCDAASFSLTNTKGLQVLEETEPRAEKNTLTLDLDDKSRCHTNSPLPCKIEKNPVVRLLDCRYIKALLKPTADKNIPSDTVHCGFLHAAHGQTKVLPSSRVMGQNDLKSGCNIVQAGRSFTQKIVVEKDMCQSRKNFSRCQNGKKQFGESKWCMDFEKPSKRIKMSEDLEEEEKVLTNVTVHKECPQQIENRTFIADSSVALEKLKCNGATLSSLDIPGFLLEQDTQKHPDQMVSLSDSKEVTEEHFISCNGSDFLESELHKKDSDILESENMEPQIDLSNQEEEVGPTMVKILASEKISSSKAAVHLKRRKRTPKGKKVSKAWRKWQLFSCQRVVPISGKNKWPLESCARTSSFVCKNHAWHSEREFLRGIDSVANSGQIELCKTQTDTSKASVNKIVGCKTEIGDKSSTSKSLLGTCKAVTGYENRLFSTDTEGAKQYTSTSTKKVKKSKKTVISPSKNKGRKAKRNIPVDMQNGVFAGRSKRETGYQKSSLAKEEQLLRTLNTRNLTNFKIPLLKNKGITSPKIEYAKSPVKETCNPLDILEDDTTSVQKARVTEMSSDANFGHFSSINAVTETTLKESEHKVDSCFPESRSKETYMHSNEGVEISHKNVIESSTWQENSNSFSSGHREKKILNCTVASEIKETEDGNDFSQHKDNLIADILKAYENDFLILDVIQDDPDLFGDTSEQEAKSPEEYAKSNFDVSNISKEKLELKESESSPLSRSRDLKCCPRESPKQGYGTLKSMSDGCVSIIEVDKIKSDSLNGTGSTGDVSETSSEDGQLTELDNLIKNSDSDGKYNSLDKMLAVKEEKPNIQEIAKMLAIFSSSTLDFRFPRKGPPMPSAYPNRYESWKVDKNEVTNLGLNRLPNRYCRVHFNTLNGCQRKKCWYLHVPESGNEKLCNEILKKYISIGEVVLLQRAVQIFTDYCKEVNNVVHLDSQILNELLTSLLQCCLIKELFCAFHTSIMIKILPPVDFLLKVFEHVTMMKIREAVPELIDICCKHCKEKGDWATLGAVYINVRRSCENFGDFENYSLCVANILANSVKEDTPGVPFCEFASAVFTDSRHNEADVTLLGRIGISILFSYFRTQQWSKAKKILDTLYNLQIPFTFLKGLIGQERSASRCQIVNTAVEIFLKSGNLERTLWVLRDTLDVSQYSLLFNKLLAACSEGKNLSISSAITEFMFAKNIPIEFHLLRALITALGRSYLWVKARTCYKSALALGCYPPLEGNLYRKLLLIPSYMTEIEMLLAIEIFLVSNASSIQSPGASSHILQIVLKRCEGDSVRNKDDYHSAADRLIQAARISTPKLFIKHLTVNVNKEQVYSLEYAAALKWLKENMKWAGKAWLFQ